MFKVGDWVRVRNERIKIGKIIEVDEFYYTIENYGQVDLSDVELWLPKEGEWVVCGLSNMDDAFWVIKYNEHEVISLSEYNPHEDVIIQPFIGEFPSFLKENR